MLTPINSGLGITDFLIEMNNNSEFFT